MARKLFDVLEAIYVAGGSEAEWLGRTLEAGGVLSEGLGIALLAMDRRGDAVRDCKVYGDADASWLSWFEAAVRAMPPRHVRLAFSWASSGKTASSIMRSDFPAYEAGMSPYGFRDLETSFGLVDRTTSFGIYVPLAEPRRETRAQRARLRMLGAHLGAGFRARTREDDEAWFHPDGRLCDARGDAVEHRDELRSFVARLDKARTRGASWEEDDALSAWTAMVEGRWTLLDLFESDGRRFVVARPNAPELGRQLALTPREELIAKLHGMGQTSKYVAYSLGLSPAAVSVHLANAMLKLRVKNRGELLRLYRALASEP